MQQDHDKDREEPRMSCRLSTGRELKVSVLLLLSFSEQ
jgi:hypothetical protein